MPFLSQLCQSIPSFILIFRESITKQVVREYHLAQLLWKFLEFCDNPLLHGIQHFNMRINRLGNAFDNCILYLFHFTGIFLDVRCDHCSCIVATLCHSSAKTILKLSNFLMQHERRVEVRRRHQNVNTFRLKDEKNVESPGGVSHGLLGRDPDNFWNNCQYFLGCPSYRRNRNTLQHRQTICEQLIGDNFVQYRQWHFWLRFPCVHLGHLLLLGHQERTWSLSMI